MLPLPKHKDKFRLQAMLRVAHARQAALLPPEPAPAFFDNLLAPEFPAQKCYLSLHTDVPTAGNELDVPGYRRFMIQIDGSQKSALANFGPLRPKSFWQSALPRIAYAAIWDAAEGGRLVNVGIPLTGYTRLQAGDALSLDIHLSPFWARPTWRESAEAA